MKWFDKIFGDMPKWMKNTIFFLLFLGLLYVIYMIYSHFKEKADKKKLQDTVDNSETELKKQLKHQSLSYSPPTYDGWANQIQTLLEGCDFDTNVVDMISIFSNIKNDADYLKLIVSFGVREMDECGWGTGSYNADLPTVIRKETSAEFASTVNSEFIKKGMKSRI